MPYGTIKVDNITFDNGGTDKLLTVSGLFFSTSGALTVTGTISGGNVTAPTATFTTLTGTTTAGTTATFTSGSFTSLTGVTTTVTSGIFDAGSATAPSVAVGTGTTYKPGIYSPGADQLAISTAGIGRLFVDASGRAGIGVSLPSEKLDVYAGSLSVGSDYVSTLNTDYKIRLRSVGAATNNNYLIEIGATGSGPQPSDSDLTLATRTWNGSAYVTTEKARLTATGRLGIGTISPLYPLHVEKNQEDLLALVNTGISTYRLQVKNDASLAVVQNSTERLRITSAGLVGIGTSAPGARLSVLSADNVAATTISDFGANNGTSAIQIGYNRITQVNSIPASAYLQLGVSNKIDAMFIDGTGRVGIGTSSPQAPLDIGFGSFQSVRTYLSSVTDIYHLYRGTPDGVGFEHARVFSGRDTSVHTYGSYLAFYTEGKGSGTTDTSTEKLRIDSSGRVGIGTSSPGEKLTVAGNISLSAAQPYISLIDSIWGVGSTLRSGVNTLGTATGDYQLFNVPTGKGFAFAQNNATNSLVIDTSGKVGIGTSSPQSIFHIGANAPANAGVKAYTALANSYEGFLFDYYYNTSANNRRVFDVVALGAGSGGAVGGSDIRFLTVPASATGTPLEAMRIDSSGRLLVGTPTSIGLGGILQIVGGDAARPQIHRNINDIYPAVLYMSKARGTGVQSVSSGDEIATIAFDGFDGTQELGAAAIRCFVDGTPGTNDMPGRLVFSTTADGAAGPTERMRIPNGGGLSVGSTVNPNALTQASGIRLGANTIASYDFTNITTSPVTIANGVGIGGLAFVQAYNTANGAQYIGIIMWRYGAVAVVSESNALGFGLTYSVSGSTLILQTASGTVTGSIISMGS